jgi:hypothetical protein
MRLCWRPFQHSKDSYARSRAAPSVSALCSSQAFSIPTSVPETAARVLIDLDYEQRGSLDFGNQFMAKFG